MESQGLDQGWGRGLDQGLRDCWESQGSDQGWRDCLESQGSDQGWRDCLESQGLDQGWGRGLDQGLRDCWESQGSDQGWGQGSGQGSAILGMEAGRMALLLSCLCTMFRRAASSSRLLPATSFCPWRRPCPHTFLVQKSTHFLCACPTGIYRSVAGHTSPLLSCLYKASPHLFQPTSFCP